MAVATVMLRMAASRTNTFIRDDPYVSDVLRIMLSVQRSDSQCQRVPDGANNLPSKVLDDLGQRLSLEIVFEHVCQAGCSDCDPNGGPGGKTRENVPYRVLSDSTGDDAHGDICTCHKRARRALVMKPHHW